MGTDTDNDALHRLQSTLSGTAEALFAFIDCAESGIAPPESLVEAAKHYGEELLRYMNGIRFDGSH
jgi:hypothetical protein